jgi:predicted phosphoribosyltransferase
LALDVDKVRSLNWDGDKLKAFLEEELRVLERRLFYFRPDHRLPEMAGRDVIVADDFAESGLTALAALKFLRGERPGRIILALPVAPEDLAKELSSQVDELICLRRPEHLGQPQNWYEHFEKLESEDVFQALKNCRK